MHYKLILFSGLLSSLMAACRPSENHHVPLNQADEDIGRCKMLHYIGATYKGNTLAVVCWDGYDPAVNDKKAYYNRNWCRENGKLFDHEGHFFEEIQANTCPSEDSIGRCISKSRAITFYKDSRIESDKVHIRQFCIDIDGKFQEL